MLRSIFLTLIIGFALDVFAWNYPENLLDIPFEGMGTQENPYIIGSAQDLCNLSWKVNNGFSYKDSYFKVTADIDLQSKEWIPIGSGGTSFQGYFEGDGHTISNLVVRSPKVYKYWSYYSYLYDYSIGLFGNIEEATITNLNLLSYHFDINFEFDSKENDNSYNYYIGGIVGKMKASSIIKCNVEGIIQIDNCSEAKVRYIGGILGISENGNSFVDLTFNGNIEVDSKDDSYLNYVGIGGIAGFLNGREIKDLTNRAPVRTYGGWKTGGIAGFLSLETNRFSDSVVKNLINKGDISIEKGVCCGIANQLYLGNLLNSYNYGNLTHSKDGGICYGISDDMRVLTMKGCSNYGNVSGVGLVGYADYLGLIEDCNNLGDVEYEGLIQEAGVGINDTLIIRNCENRGKANIGILGNSGIHVTMENCHNYGLILGKASLVGDAQSLEMNDCSNSGDIDGSKVFFKEYFVNKVYYNSYVGGLVAYCKDVCTINNSHNKGNVVGCRNAAGIIFYANSINMNSCINEGKISVIDNSELSSLNWNSTVYAAGLVGISRGTIENCHNLGSVTTDSSQEPHTQNIYYEGPLAAGVSADFSGNMSDVYNCADVQSLQKGYVGGLIGNVGDYSFVNSENVCITRCSHTGKLISYAEGGFAGGLCYSSQGVTFNDCYASGEFSASNVGGLTGIMAFTSFNSCFSYAEMKGNVISGLGNSGQGNSYNGAKRAYWLRDRENIISDMGKNKISGEIEGFSKEDFLSGKVCVALNNGRKEDAPWGQTPLKDLHPLLNAQGDPELTEVEIVEMDNRVYRVYNFNGYYVGSFSKNELRKLEPGFYILHTSEGKNLKIHI